MVLSQFSRYLPLNAANSNNTANHNSLQQQDFVELELQDINPPPDQTDYTQYSEANNNVKNDPASVISRNNDENSTNNCALLNKSQESEAECDSTGHAIKPVDIETPWILRLLDRIHPNFHYCYILLAVSGFVNFLGAAGSTFGIGFYSEDLQEALDVSAATIGLSWSIALFATALIIPKIGKLVDKYGLRKIAPICVIPYCLSLIWLSFIKDIYSLTAALFILRTSVNSLGLIAQNLSNYWYIQRKGFAISITNSIGNLSLIFPSLLSAIRSSALVGGSWRGTFIVEAIVGSSLLVIIANLTLNRPELYGRLPDAKNNNTQARALLINNDSNATDNAANNNNSTNQINPAHGEVNWYYHDAVRTKFFWIVVLSSCVTGLLWSGFNFHFVSILRESGITATIPNVDISDLVFIPISITAVVTMLGAGPLFDRIQNKVRGLLLTTICCAASLICLLTFPAVAKADSASTSTFIIILFAVLYGTMNSIQMTGYAIIFSYTFGRLHLASIDGLAAAFLTVSVGVGPLFFGLVRTFSGSYEAIFILLLVLSVAATVVLMLSRTPRLPAQVIPL
jgi:MFS family permease